jgi:hypothetical protein
MSRQKLDSFVHQAIPDGGRTVARQQRTCRPETLKMLLEIFGDVARMALARGVVCDAREDLAMRQQLGKIILALHSDGEEDPNVIRSKALERFLELPNSR